MTNRSPRQLNRTFVLLLGLAACAIALSGHVGSSALVLVALFALAVAKARLIIFDFLGMRDAPSALRIALLGWSVVFAAGGIAKALLSGVLGS